MKKYNEGYALLSVGVVMAALFFCISAIMPLSVKNLQAQQRSIERMEEKYAAQGAIEMVVAELQNTNKVKVPTITEITEDKKEAALKDRIIAVCTDKLEEEIEVDLKTIDENQSEFSCTFKICSNYKSIKINSTITWSGIISEPAERYAECPVGSLQVSYGAYDIQRGGD